MSVTQAQLPIFVNGFPTELKFFLKVCLTGAQVLIVPFFLAGSEVFLKT